MLRAGVLLLIVALPLIARSQTSEELRQKYGAPGVETFSVEPGISMSVAYASEGQPCEILLEGPHPLVRRSDEQTALMPTDRVSQWMEELSPTEQRGKQLNHVLTESGCNTFAMTEYERVVITRSQHNCEPQSPNRDGQVVITFKLRACRVP